MLNVVLAQNLRDVARHLRTGGPGTVVLLQRDDYTGEGGWCNLFGPADVLAEIRPRVADRKPLVGKQPRHFAALSVVGTAQDIKNALLTV